MVTKQQTKRSFSLAAKDIHTRMAVNRGDYDIITIYSRRSKKPRTTVLHDMIGQAAVCWEKGHARKIEELQDIITVLAAKLDQYHQKYGK